MTTFQHLTTQQVAYLAGFLDGDGCINAQIVRRPDYRLGFQIRVSVTFYQKTSRYWFLVGLQKTLGCGTLRQRPDGVSEFALVGRQTVASFLRTVKSCLCLKRRQARTVLQICDKISRDQEPEDFLKTCEQVDRLEGWNDSKTRSIRAAEVKEHLQLS